MVVGKKIKTEEKCVREPKTRKRGHRLAWPIEVHVQVFKN